MRKLILIIILITITMVIAIATMDRPPNNPTMGVNETDQYIDYWNQHHIYRLDKGGTQLTNPPNIWANITYCINLSLKRDNGQGNNKFNIDDCSDNFSMTWSYDTDNEKYVNVTGTTKINTTKNKWGTINLTINHFLEYHYPLTKINITIDNGLKKDIHNLQFRVENHYIQIGNNIEGDYLRIKNTSGDYTYFDLSETYNNHLIEIDSFRIIDGEEYIRFDFREDEITDNFIVKLNSNEEPNTPVIVIKEFGDIGEDDNANFIYWWVDAISGVEIMDYDVLGGYNDPYQDKVILNSDGGIHTIVGENDDNYVLHCNSSEFFNGSEWSCNTLSTAAITAHSSLAIRTDDRIMAVILDDLAKEIYSYYSDNKGTSWTLITSDMCGGGDIEKTVSLATDQNDNFHMCTIVDDANDYLYYANSSTGTSWSSCSQVSSAEAYDTCDIEIDSNDMIHIVADDNDGDILHLNFTVGGTPSGATLTTVEGGTGFIHSNIAIDSSDNLWVAYAASTLNWFLSNSSDGGLSWTNQNSSPFAAGHDVVDAVVELDTSDGIHLFWVEDLDTSDYAIRYTTSTDNGQTWSTYTTLQSNANYDAEDVNVRGSLYPSTNRNSDRLDYIFRNTESGNITYSNKSTSDFTNPIITIDSPTNTTYLDANSIDLNYSVSDDYGLSQCWYEWLGTNSTSDSSCSNVSLSGLNETQYNVTVYVNDTTNNMNQSQVFFTLNDSKAPDLSIDSPTNSTYNTTTIDLNYSVNEPFIIEGCWYEWLGANSTFDATCSNTTLSNLNNSQYNVTVFVNDSYNNINSSQVFFTFDNVPIINSNATVNATPNWEEIVYITANVTDPGNNINEVNFTIFAPNGTAMVNNVNGTWDGTDTWNSTDIFVDAVGNWSWFVNVSDTTGNNASTYGTFNIDDTVYPSLNLTAPANETNFTSTESSGLSDINLSWNAWDDKEIDSCWYHVESLNYGSEIANTTIDCNINSTLFNVTRFDQFTLWFYTNDTINNTNRTTTTFNVAYTGETPTGSPGGGGSDIVERIIYVSTEECEERNWSITTIQGTTTTTVLLPKESTKPRSKEFIITNKELFNYSIDIECQSIESDICDYVNISKKNITLQSTQLKSEFIDYYITTPEGAEYGDEWNFNMVAYDQDNCPKKLDVNAQVSRWMFAFRWFQLGRYNFPIVLPALLFSILGFMLVRRPLKKSYPLTSTISGLGVGMGIFIIIFLI